MDDKLQEIQRNIDSTQAAINAGGVTDAQLNVWEMQIADFKTQYAARTAELQAESDRTQAQTEKVDSIVLPLDFNALFENTAANDMIIEVVKEFQTQAYADHNAEIAQVNADWTDRVSKINVMSATEVGVLNSKINDLQFSLDNVSTELKNQLAEKDEISKNLGHSMLEKADAEQKRDAAANEIIRLNSHIDDLQLQLANAPAPKAAIEIGSTDRLEELAAKAKESNADKMARALARWNTDHADQTVDIPELKQIDEEPAAVSTPQVPTTIPGVDGNEATTEVVGTKEEAAVTPVSRAEIDAITFRLSAVEAHLNIPAAA